MQEIELGMLDLLPTYGESARQAAMAAIEQAQLADALGYAHYWLTQHHSWCADSSPELLLPLMAATTRRIRVGVAGVLLNFHRPYQVARSFQVLEALFPGRIDLGLCRGSVSEAVWTALLGTYAGEPSYEAFVGHTEALMAHLHEQVTVDGEMRAQPLPATWLLGAGTGTMQLAARLGTAYCHSLCHQGSQDDPGILATYHRVAGAQRAPQAAVLVGGICAERHGDALELRRQHVNPSLEVNVVGTPAACADQLKTISHHYGVKRLVWLDLSPHREALRDSMRLVADAMQLHA